MGMNYTLTEILSAYKDCGISYGQAFSMITGNPPNGLGYPSQTAADYLNSTQRNCGNNRPDLDPTKPEASEASQIFSEKSQYPSIPDNFYGFLLLLGGLR